MAALVGLERALTREALAAAWAEVGSPLPEDTGTTRVWRGHARVRALVVEQEARLAEAAAALRALVRLLAAVDALVREQVLLEAEAAAALGAREGPLAGVCALVHLQVVFDAEGLAALGTHEGGGATRPYVRLLVPHQAGLLGEGLAAQRAAVGLFLCRVVDNQALVVPQTLLPVPRRRPFPGGHQLCHGHFQMQSPAPGEAEAERGIKEDPTDQPFSSLLNHSLPITPSVCPSAALFRFLTACRPGFSQDPLPPRRLPWPLQHPLAVCCPALCPSPWDRVVMPPLTPSQHLKNRELPSLKRHIKPCACNTQLMG